MQQQDLIYCKQYMQQLYSLKDQNTIMRVLKNGIKEL